MKSIFCILKGFLYVTFPCSEWMKIIGKSPDEEVYLVSIGEKARIADFETGVLYPPRLWDAILNKRWDWIEFNAQSKLKELKNLQEFDAT